MLSIPSGWAETVHTHIILQAVSCPFTLTTIFRGFEREVLWA